MALFTLPVIQMYLLAFVQIKCRWLLLENPGVFWFFHIYNISFSEARDAVIFSLVFISLSYV